MVLGKHVQSGHPCVQNSNGFSLHSEHGPRSLPGLLGPAWSGPGHLSSPPVHTNHTDSLFSLLLGGSLLFPPGGCSSPGVRRGHTPAWLGLCSERPSLITCVKQHTFSPTLCPFPLLSFSSPHLNFHLFILYLLPHYVCAMWAGT